MVCGNRAAFFSFHSFAGWISTLIIALYCSTSSCRGSSSHVNSSVRTSDQIADAALHTIFNKYGSNGTITFEAFEHLLHSLGLGNIVYMDHDVDKHRGSNGSFVAIHSDHEHASRGHVAKNGKDVILSANLVMEHDHEEDHSTESPTVPPEELIQKLDTRMCSRQPPSKADHDHDNDNDHDHESHDDCAHSNGTNNSCSTGYSHSASVWGFSFLACLIISAVGLVAVAIIPIMPKVLYNHMLQFLVALAVGSLTGDSILHLLPHALTPHNEHHSQRDGSHGGHDRHAVWCGLTALGGIYIFFLVERIVGMCSERKRSRKDRRIKEMQDCEATGGDASSSVHMMNSSLQPVTAKGSGSHLGADSLVVGTKLPRHTDPATSCEEILMMVHTNKEVRKFADDAHNELHQHCDPMVKTNTWGHNGNSSSGGHNHSHFVSGSVASVAWMVIVGDGFHNFADGLAIGSAFASSLIGGLSTSIAVFCHELPHELGDFAMLLNAGMSPKQALVYNCVSSVLCLFGMIIGIVVGNIAAATAWIFAVVAGLFLYVALVDMLPEMTKMYPKKGEHPMLHLVLQNSGMLVGVSVMLAIALFEDQLQHAFS